MVEVYFPDVENLKLSDVSEFTTLNSVVSSLKLFWKDDYFKKALNTWSLSVKSFKNNSELNMSLEEMIFCMEYDYVLGPSIGVPENKKIEYYQWLFEQMKKITK